MASFGADFEQPEAVIAANGGSIDLHSKAYQTGVPELGSTTRIVPLLEQTTSAGLFVNEKRIGKHAGPLSIDDIGLIGEAKTPYRQSS